MAQGIGVDFDLERVDRAIRMLQAVGRSREFMAQIGEEMVAAARQRLGGSEGPHGPWPGLRPAYAAMRAEMHPNATGMLQVSGMLGRSLTFEAGEASVKVGSPLIYAGVHQAGAVIVPRKAESLIFPLMGQSGVVFLEHAKSVRIPARPYLGLGEPERLGIERAYQRAIQRAFEA